MKTMKKMFAMLLAVVMVMGLSVTTFADTEKGSVTVENATIGQTYTAYKVFDLTYVTTGTGDDATTNVAYTYTKTGDSDALYTALTGTDSPFTLTATTTTNVYNVSTTANAAAIASFLKALVDKGTLTTTITAITPTMENQKVEFKNLDLGYYFITSSLGSVVTIDSTTPDATVIDKNTQEPTPPQEGLKTIVVNGQKVEGTSASVGDVLNFRMALNTVNWVTKEDGTTEKVTTYTFTDTPTNMKIKQDSVAVTVTAPGEGATVQTLQPETNYKVTFGANGNMTVVVYWTDTTTGNSLYNNNSLLEVTYTAEITSTAANGSASNSATAKWNNSTPVNDNTEVKTYSFDLTKVDASDYSKRLAGAEFSVYESEVSETAIVLVKDSDGVYHVADAAEKESDTVETTTTIVTPDSGVITVKGLGNGTYYVEETKAPNGYNMLTSRKSITIDGANITNGTFTVENSTGSSLPSTGGIGTTIFYVIGAVLVLGAAILLITKKRMKGAEK